MNLKEALLTQAPSLALQRAAADEIARLTKALEDAKARRVPVSPDELIDRCWEWRRSGVRLQGLAHAFEAGFRDAERIHGIENKGN